MILDDVLAMAHDQSDRQQDLETEKCQGYLPHFRKS